VKIGHNFQKPSHREPLLTVLRTRLLTTKSKNLRSKPRKYCARCHSKRNRVKMKRFKNLRLWKPRSWYKNRYRSRCRSKKL